MLKFTYNANVPDFNQMAEDIEEMHAKIQGLWPERTVAIDSETGEVYVSGSVVGHIRDAKKAGSADEPITTLSEMDEIAITFYRRILPDHATHTEQDVYVGPWKIGKLISWPNIPGTIVRFCGHWYGTDSPEMRDYESREAFLKTLNQDAQ